MPIGRSENMRRIRSKDTAPELAVRSTLRALGHVGYRLHRKDLPGRPDIVFLRQKKAVMVHGCFWHGHDCNEGRRIPKSNKDYWVDKIARNRVRDAKHLDELATRGWEVFTVWECEIKDPTLPERLTKFLGTPAQERAALQKRLS